MDKQVLVDMENECDLLPKILPAGWKATAIVARATRRAMMLLMFDEVVGCLV